jgi:hypothetical protein
MAPALDSLIGQLWCMHWPAGHLPGHAVARVRTSGVVLDTCLRQLAFGLGKIPGAALESPGDLHSGPAAYGLLLEVASGLRSAIPGETNVFGQFRRAWERSAGELPADQRWHLTPVVTALLADTRQLRTRHLQGLGGNSYGSLVRELLALRRDARILFVGTGDLARSMVPLFRNYAVGAWNRSPGAPLDDVCQWFTSDAADEAAGWATDVVFTTPADPHHDAAWSGRLGRHVQRGVVHLGQRGQSAGSWPSAAATFGLDDVFALARARDQWRSRQLAAAARTCAELVAARLGATPLPGAAPRPVQLRA